MYKRKGKAGKESDLTPHLHLGKYYRYLWEDTNLLAVIGYFPEVLRSKELYDERYHIAPVAESAASSLYRLMGAAALAAVSLAERESWGWTVTLPGSDVGLFCGVEPEGIITAQVRQAPSTKQAIYVQRQKGKAPASQSMLEPAGDDPAAAVTLYFDQAVQTETRIALDAEYSGVLVQPLPGGRFAEVENLESDKLIELFRQMASRGELKPMGEVLVFYECRCDDPIILDMITSLPQAERDAIWAERTSLSIECPRCGREYTIERSAQ